MAIATGASHADFADFADYSSILSELTRKTANKSKICRQVESVSGSDIFDQLNYRSGQKSNWRFKQINDTSILHKEFHITERKHTTETTTKLNARSTTSLHLNTIKNVFSLSDEELASILGASRKTIYNWQQGLTKPNKKKLERILTQSVIADEWVSNGYPSSDQLDAVEKNELVHLLTSESLNKDGILFFGSGLMLTKDALEIEDPFA